MKVGVNEYWLTWERWKDPFTHHPHYPHSHGLKTWGENLPYLIDSSIATPPVPSYPQFPLNLLPRKVWTSKRNVALHAYYIHLVLVQEPWMDVAKGEPFFNNLRMGLLLSTGSLILTPASLYPSTSPEADRTRWLIKALRLRRKLTYCSFLKLELEKWGGSNWRWQLSVTSDNST